jgi:hypothetical protein
VHCGGNSRVKTEFGALNMYRVLQSTSGHFLNMYHYTNASLTIVRVMKSKRMRWAGNVARMGERRDLYCDLVGKPEGKGSLGRPRRRWEDNIGMDLQGRVDWIELAQDRDRWRALVNAVMNLVVP